MRYWINKFIYVNHSLPHGGDPVIRDAVWGYSYAFFPILVNIIGTVFMTIVSWFSQGKFVLLMAARMVSVLCGVGMAWFCLRIGEKIWKRREFKWLFAIFATLMPQSIYLFSYINNDCMALLATAMIIYSWLLGLEENWSYKSCILMAAGIILCALSYYNAYGVILASMLLLGGCLINSWRDKEKRGKLLKRGLLIAVIVLVGISWWFIRNYMLYDGDMLGLTTSEAYSEKYAIDSIKPSNRVTPANMGQSLWYMFFEGGWLRLTAKSFFGCFGYVSIPLKLWMYLAYAIITGLGLAGLCFGLRKGKKESETKRIYFIPALLLTAVIPNILNIAHSYYVDFQPQGRYSMPMLIPFMCFITWGWEAAARRFRSEKARKWLAWGISIFWIFLAVISYLFVFRKAIG